MSVFVCVSVLGFTHILQQILGLGLTGFIMRTCGCLFFVLGFTHILLQILGLPISLADTWGADTWGGLHHILLQILGLHHASFFYDMGFRLILCSWLTLMFEKA